MDDHVNELIPAHVLGALTPDEAARVESHVSECSTCMATLKEAESTTALLALATPQIAPPPELRDRLMAAIEPAPELVPEPTPEPRAERRTDRTPGWWPRFARIAAPVLAVVVIGLVAWNVSLRNSLTNTQDIVYGSKTSAALANVGTVFVDANGQATLVANASTAPSGKTYQAWVIPPGGKPIPAGVFAGGRTSLDLETETHPGDTVAVTVEPAGGSQQPTTQPIAASKVA